jgi:hypothetical protein
MSKCSCELHVEDIISQYLIENDSPKIENGHVDPNMYNQPKNNTLVLEKKKTKEEDASKAVVYSSGCSLQKVE